MATLNFSDIFNDMVSAAKTALAEKWPVLKELTTSSVTTLAQNIVDIEKMSEEGTITKEQAALKMSLQKDAFKILLLSNAGIALLLAEQVLNAVISIVRDVVNAAIGFALL